MLDIGIQLRLTDRMCDHDYKIVINGKTIFRGICLSMNWRESGADHGIASIVVAVAF